VAVGALEQKFWANLCRALGCEQFIPDQFIEGPRRQEIVDALAAIFRTRTAEEWFDRLRNCDVCVTPVRSVAEVVREFGDKVPVIPKLSRIEEK
jgi:crotonobetainyl-CoA:carnitine CoA-transferase CaiB-like acyl-CoA transferase